MNDQRKVKATFVMHRATLQEIRDLVAAGEADSQSAFVEEALADRLKARRRAALRRAYAQAAEDPQFLSDVSETMDAFERSDEEFG